MKKKFLILIEDDCEIMGNGLGNVADLQYLPALSLMNIADKYGAKVTFMVDVAHQLAMRNNIQHPEIKVQSKLWDEMVLLMAKRDFDVQLHLHSQWVNSTYENGFFHLTDIWNIGRLSPEEQAMLITESIQYLESLLRTLVPEYKVCAFKAGSWGLQPSAFALSELEQMGVSIVMGMRDGLKIYSQQVDYSGMEEKYLPYYPKRDDLTKVSNRSDSLSVIPLQPYSSDLLTFSKLIFNHAIARFRYRSSLQYSHSGAIPAEFNKLKPLRGRNDFVLGLRPYRTHLKIGNQPFSYLKKSFDTVIERLREFDAPRIPVLIESHTKQYANNYGNIERFIAYIAEHYDSEAEFGDLSGYNKELQENPDLARSKR